MSSRKRKSKADISNELTQSKKAKVLPSSLWQYQEDNSEIHHSLRVASKIRKRPAILSGAVNKEKPSSLVNRIHDPITKEVIEPDQHTDTQSAPDLNRVRRIIQRQELDITTAKSELTAPDYSPRFLRSREKPSGILGKGPKGRKEVPKAILPDYPPPRASNHPRVYVRISQDKNLDKDLYIPYQTSPSTQATSSEVSSVRTVPSYIQDSVNNGIVSDSHSLPGSSSYLPTSTKSRSTISAEQLDSIVTERHLQIPASNPSTERISSTFAVTDPHRSVEISSGILVPASQPSDASSQRSKSAPLLRSADARSSCSSDARQPLSRSISDSASLLNSERQSQEQTASAERPTGHYRDIQRSFGCPLPPGLSPQADSPYFQNSTEIQVPGSIEHGTHPKSSRDSQYEEEDLVFQTQVPLSSTEDQEDSTLGPDFAKRGNAITDLNHSSSQLSGRDVSNWTRKPKTQGIVLDTVQQAVGTSIQNRGTEAFEILEDSLKFDHPSQATTTDDSVLSIRDPNSQPSQPPSGQIFISTVGIEAEDSRKGNLLKPSESGFGAALATLEPPQPPVLSDDDMSNMFPDGRHEGGPRPLTTKEKLQQIRQRRVLEAQQYLAPSTQASPILNIDRSQYQTPAGQMSAQSPHDEQHQSPSLAARPPPPLVPEQALSSSIPNDVSSSSFTRDQAPTQVPSTVIEQFRAGTRTPDIIPDKLAYEVQAEPERLEVQPVLVSTELPLPMRSSQSVPHTPVTPSKLIVHKEISPSQTTNLEPRNLGKSEFIVPLCMQKRIHRQYVETIEYYPASIKQNMTAEDLGQNHINKLNELLGRLANVANHIGLEGGGPDSQDSVQSEQEAVYAEMSSEKFKFLGYLFDMARDQPLHIALIARSGPLHDIIETFLKGKKVLYNRPGTFSRSDPRSAHGQLQVSVIASGKEGESGVTVARKADLVIALDETFNASDNQIIELRTSNTNIGHIAPVIRLVVYSSVEHLDLCLSRSKDPVDRLRKLIFCVWHTQSLVGELESHEPDTEACAVAVVTFLRSGCQASAWTVPPIHTIENIPVMDTDSSLSDAMSDVSVEVGRPNELDQKFWPNTTAPFRASNPKNVPLASGKRPFDLEYGDSLETQTKKQKLAQRSHAGQPTDEPHSMENLERWLAETRERERRLVLDKELMADTIASHEGWAERRQKDYEELREKHSTLHHDKIDLLAEVAKFRKEINKAQSDRNVFHEERDGLKVELDTLRLQLISHPNPNIAEPSRMDARIRELEAENATQKKKLDSANGQLDYTREMYQETSGRAVELAKELEELQRESEPLKRKLEHEYARRKHERENDPNLELRKEKEALKEALKTKDRLIIKKEEEIKDLKRGRQGVQTRGNSVQPRSPKGSSRGASPAAGMLGAAMSRGPSGLSSRYNVEASR